MNNVLAEFVGKFVMVFIDDIIVYSKNEEEHQRHVELVLTKLREAGLTLKDSKCSWAKSQTNLLGYVVSAEGRAAQPAKTEAIRQLAAPRDVPELRRFLGMTGYYRDLIPGYARIAEPLYLLTRKSENWEWGERQSVAYEALKVALVSDRIMAHPQTDKPYILRTDACDYAIGGILCQIDEKEVERPLQYVSAQLRGAQLNWATIQKEAYAVVYCLKKLRAYLIGSEFKCLHRPQTLTVLIYQGNGQY
jgi:hypothetical protein